MSDHLVVAVLTGMEPSDGLRRAVADVHPDAEVLWTPYVESEALRSARGHHGGRNPGHEAPTVDDASKRAWSRADVVIALDLPDDLESLMPRLGWVQSITAGYEKYDLAALARQGVRLTTASGLGASSIAEFAMARLLQVAKRLRTLDELQDAHRWETSFGTELTGRTLGVVGFGAIGRQVARRARAFDMRVLATRASARDGDTDPDVDELLPSDRLDEVLARCHAVVSSLPANNATRDLFDAGRFAAMREGAFFCNVGRGAHVVEPDLIAALESGHLGAAALDVTRVEPLPADDPLWEAPNTYISPHCSVSLDRYMLNLERLLETNLARHAAGDEMENEVDLGAA